MSDIRIYTAAQAGGLTPLTGDIILCSEEFNGAPANSVHLALAGGATPTWKSFANDGAVTPPFNQYSISFSGETQYLDCGTISGLSGASAQTLSVWFKPTVAGVIPNIGWWTSSTLSYGWASTPDHSIQVFNVKNGVNEAFNITSSVPNDTDWHHYVATYDSGSVAIYIDGSSVLTGTASNSTLATQTGNFHIGRFGDVVMYEDGLYDEVALFSSALTSEQVASLIDTSGSNPVPANISSLTPSAWWRMGDDENDTFVDGGSVASITDSSGNGNTATQATAANQPTFSTSVPA